MKLSEYKLLLVYCSFYMPCPIENNSFRKIWFKNIYNTLSFKKFIFGYEIYKIKKEILKLIKDDKILNFIDKLFRITK